MRKTNSHRQMDLFWSPGDPDPRPTAKVNYPRRKGGGPSRPAGQALEGQLALSPIGEEGPADSRRRSPHVRRE